MEFILPYYGAVDAFLAIVRFLPQPVTAYIAANFFFFAVVAAVRRFLDS